MKQLKIATWNVNSLKVRLPHVLAWLAQISPDILALQETKLTNDNFPIEAIKDAGYQVIYNGQKTYNGVAILSKQPAQDVLIELPILQDPQRRMLIATINGVRIINLYVPNGEHPDSSKYGYKLHWLEHVTHFVGEQLAQYPHLVVLGDINIAPHESDVHDPDLWRGKVLFSEPERAAFSKLLALGLEDSFRLFPQAEKSYTWWDYRALSFRRNHGLRIDHILASQALAKNCVSCTIDKEPRRCERPSDHTPVWACYTIL